MKKKLTFIVIVTVGIFLVSNQNSALNVDNNDLKTEEAIAGKWVRIGQTGPISLDFKNTGMVEGDFGNDNTIDVIAQYKISHDTIGFTDKELQSCEGTGKYKIYLTQYYLAFDLIDDQCGGRIKSTIGFWVRPDFKVRLDELDAKLTNSPKPDDYLSRARMYLAIGQPDQARPDFDEYIKIDSTNARAYINRAATRFPDDFDGIIADCNQAINLEPNDKNAYFLRGLALYGQDKKEKACTDFQTAIDLGFSVLQMAEKEKCADYWNYEN